MTSGIDSDLLSDLQGTPNNAIAVFELDIDGATLKYAEAWAASSTGLYQGYVIDSGEINRSISDASFNLPRDSARVVIQDDASRSLESALMSSIGSVSGSAARIKIASTTRAQAKWFTVFQGVIDEFSSPNPLEWSFNLRRDDRPLSKLVKIPYFQEYDWGNAPEATLGTPAQVVYGTHDSTGTSATGMVPTTYVDNVDFIYAVSFGLITSVDAVYVDGVESASSNWTFDGAYFVNGRYWSVVDFTSDQGDDAVVTVDCQGVTSGGLIENPATQLEHFLTNFVFGDWASSTSIFSSAWLTTSDYNIDEDFFAEAETFLSNKQIAKGSRVISAGRQGITVLNEWTQQLQIPSFWTYGGKIAVRPDDHTLTSVYISSPHLRRETSPEAATRSVEFVTQDLTDEFQMEYLYNTAEQRFEKQITVKDSSKGYNAATGLQLNWRESVA